MLTACGIETCFNVSGESMSFFQLQQCLPLAVLKRGGRIDEDHRFQVATVLTACGIETVEAYDDEHDIKEGCNSAYRLRY